MIFQIILYIFIIILLHYLWNVLKDTFTVKKKKNSQIEINKYRQILEEQHSKIEETLEIDLEQDLQIFLQNNI